MTRICCIGTSHIGTLKGGWDQIAPRWEGLAMSFFGAPNLRGVESLSFLTLEGRAIVPMDTDVKRYFNLTSGGLSRIDLDAYDAFIVVSGVGPITSFDLYTLYRTDEQLHTDENVLLSPTCLVEAIAGIFRDTYGYRLTTALAQLTGKPVFLTPEPRPSDALRTASGSSLPIWDFYIKLAKQLLANGDHLSGAHYYKAALGAIRQPGVSVVDAPAALIVDGLFTPHAFSKGSLWLQNERYEPSPQEDFFHMNQDYGAAVLHEILTGLTARA